MEAIFSSNVLPAHFVLWVYVIFIFGIKHYITGGYKHKIELKV